MDINQVVKTLPTHNQAVALFDFYVAKVNWLYHIIHVPTVRRHLDQVYEALTQMRMPPYNRLALITTILALAAYFSPGPLGGITRDALHGTCFQNWSSFSQQCLEAANYVASPTISSLQALILVISPPKHFLIIINDLSSCLIICYRTSEQQQHLVPFEPRRSLLPMLWLYIGSTRRKTKKNAKKKSMMSLLLKSRGGFGGILLAAIG